jgi:hypothetical protein
MRLDLFFSMQSCNIFLVLQFKDDNELECRTTVEYKDESALISFVVRRKLFACFLHVP